MTTLTLTRPDVSHGCAAEYEAFATLIESLSENDWNAASRCAGWLVRDVAGHVIGLAEDTAAGVPGSRNAEEEAASVRHETPAGAAARLRTALVSIEALLDSLDDDAWQSVIPVVELTFGQGVLTLWYDTYVHGDDIRAAIGRAPETGAGLEAAVAYLAAEMTKKDQPGATVALDGSGRYDVSGGGPEISGDPHQFVLVATGRAPASSLGIEYEISIY